MGHPVMKIKSDGYFRHFTNIGTPENYPPYGILNVIINTGQNICVINISPIRADGEIGKNLAEMHGKLPMTTLFLTATNVAEEQNSCTHLYFHALCTL